MQRQALIFLCLALSAPYGQASGATPLYFSFIVSFGSHGFNSSDIIPAVDLALEHINNRSDLLVGHQLGYLSARDSEVGSFVGLFV